MSSISYIVLWRIAFSVERIVKKEKNQETEGKIKSHYVS